MSSNVTYCDDGRKWSIQRCSTQDLSVCVNCDSPCQDSGVTYLNSCVDGGIDTSGNPDEIKGLSIKFNTTIPDPYLSNFHVPSVGKFNASIDIDVSEAAYVFCDIYDSTNTAENPSYDLLVSRGLSSYPYSSASSSSGLRATVSFYDLKPSTTYNVSCTAGNLTSTFF